MTSRCFGPVLHTGHSTLRFRAQWYTSAIAWNVWLHWSVMAVCVGLSARYGRGNGCSTAEAMGSCMMGHSASADGGCSVTAHLERRSGSSIVVMEWYPVAGCVYIDSGAWGRGS